MAAADGPLAGLRILEFTGIGPAPFACMLLADLGAEVLRIERPGPAVPPAQARAMVQHRGRPALVLDLKQPAGRARALALAARADALVEGFRPGVMERLGLGPEPCLQANPRLVYGRMTGWGQDGPLAHTAGHDINYIAVTGALHAIGPAAGKPVVPLNLIGDFGGGALYLALGLVSALLEAQRGGRGQVVDAAIVDGTVSLLALVHGRLAQGVWQDRREANALDGCAPWYDTYETADARHVAVGAIEPTFWRLLCEGIGRPELAAWDRGDRSRWPALRAALRQAFLQHDRDTWAARFEDSDACVAPVLSLTEAAQHRQLRARKSLVEAGGVLQPAPAPRFSRTPGALQSPPQAPTDSGTVRAERWLAAPAVP